MLRYRQRGTCAMEIRVVFRSPRMENDKAAGTTTRMELAAARWTSFVGSVTVIGTRRLIGRKAGWAGDAGINPTRAESIRRSVTLKSPLKRNHSRISRASREKRNLLRNSKTVSRLGETRKMRFGGQRSMTSSPAANRPRVRRSSNTSEQLVGLAQRRRIASGIGQAHLDLTVHWWHSRQMWKARSWLFNRSI